MTPVTRWALRSTLIAPEWLQLDSTTNPLPRTWTITDWSSQIHRVGLPPIVGPSILEGESLLETSHPFRLTAHEHRPVEEQRGAAFFDHVDALGGEVGSTRWGHVDYRSR